MSRAWPRLSAMIAFRANGVPQFANDGDRTVEERLEPNRWRPSNGDGLVGLCKLSLQMNAVRVRPK